MTDVRRLFADLTIVLEDLHGLAVEGQHPDHTPDIQEAVLVSVRQGIRRAHRIVTAIGLELL